MTEIIKTRKYLSSVTTFLSNFKTEKTIYIPMLYDGVVENCLAVNNKVVATPADIKFEALWGTLRDQPQALSKFTELYPDSEEETSTVLSEVLKIQTKRLAVAYTLLNLTKRSSSEVLMGGRLLDKDKVFVPKYLKQLAEYKLPFELGKRSPIDCFTFQDLTYLTTDEVTKFSDIENSLFITNNKQHVYCFNEAECSMIDNYYLIWR